LFIARLHRDECADDITRLRVRRHEFLELVNATLEDIR
jgi:hypothetical protein